MALATAPSARETAHTPQADTEHTLRRFLAQFPHRQGFAFNTHTRMLLRRELYLSASSGGMYLAELFKDGAYGAYAADHVGANTSGTPDLTWVINDHKHNDAAHADRPCARKFRIGEPIYRCLTCGFDDTCALCSDCFDPEFHRDHQLYINICQRENGGVCDCGDPEAWTVPLDCQYFRRRVVEDGVIPDQFRSALLATFATVLDYVLDVMANSNLMYRAAPHAAAEVRAHSDNSSLSAAVYGAEDVNSPQFALVLYNDQVRQQQDAIRRIHLATGKVKEFATMVTREVEVYGKAVVMVSDDVDSLLERQQVMAATGFNTAIRSMRDVFREETCDEAIKWMDDISRSTCFQKYSEFRDLVCAAFVSRWRIGINDQLAPGPWTTGPTAGPTAGATAGAASSNTDYVPGNLTQHHRIPCLRESQPENHPKHWDFEYSRWDLPADLCREIGYNDDELLHGQNSGRSFLGSRFQYLLFMDIRFWRSIRLVLHDFYIFALISNLEYKQVVNCQYVDIYPQVTEMFLTTDREAESSALCSLSTQLFTCPSNATTIVKHGSITRFLAVFYSHITKNVIEGPNSVDITEGIIFANLKNRKWCQMFFDISYILSRNEQVDLVFNATLLNQIIDVLLLFQGTPTLKRSPVEHVEYESSDYTVYFQSISILNHFAEGFTRCINRLQDTTENRTAVCNVVKLVIERLGTFIDAAPQQQQQLQQALQPSKILSDARAEPVHWMQAPRSNDKIISFQVSRQSVSFIHSLHGFLSWLIELNKFLDTNTALQSLFAQYHLQQNNDYALKIFDYPLRTLVLLSQIKVGFWVRNGFSVRTQMQIYRKSTIRDGGYSRDLFLAQCFVASMPASVTAATIFARWELIPWIEGAELRTGMVPPAQQQQQQQLTSSCYGKDTTPLMVEECLLFLINLLTDDSHLQQLTGDKVSEFRTIKEIICALCFQPLSFSDLMKEIPDHIASEKIFEYILDEVADFVPPKNFNDVGVYKLKERYFDEIDPFFIHYSSNKRDEAIEVLKKRIHKKTGEPIDQICLEPKIIDLEGKTAAIYQKIPQFTTTEIFVEFLESTLKYVLSRGVEKTDTLLDLVLYLLAISCLYNYDDKFVDLMTSSSFNIACLLYELVSKEEYKPFHMRIRSVFKYVVAKSDSETFKARMEQTIPNFDGSILFASTTNGGASDTETELERKKKMAEKRKLKILAKFKKQQQKFIEHSSVTSAAEQSDTEMPDADSASSTGAGMGAGANDGPNEMDSASCWNFPEEHCILCQMHKEDEPFGVVASIVSSPEFRSVPFDDPYWFVKSFSDNENLDHENVDFSTDPRYSTSWHSFVETRRQEVVIGPAFPHRDGLVEDHHIITSCSHGMHYSCFLQYYKDSRKRATQITRKLPEDFDKQEYLCPLCKSLNNCFVPIVAANNRSSLQKYLEPNSSTEWYSGLQSLGKADFQELKDNYVMSAIVSSREHIFPSYYQALFVNTERERKFHTNLVHSLASNLNMIGNLGDVFRKPSVDQILLHTIQSVEVSLRGVAHKNHENGILINQISNQLLTTLRVFNSFRDTVELMNIFASSKREHRGELENGKKFVSVVEQALARYSLLGSPDDLADILLTVDFFEMLVECGSVNHVQGKAHAVLRTCFIGHVLQCAYLLLYKITSQIDVVASYMHLLPTVEYSFDTSKVKSLVASMVEHIGVHSKFSIGDTDKLSTNDEFITKFFSMLVKLTTPFLRQAAIFSFVKCANTTGVEFDKYDVAQIECDRLCSFLQIPTLDSLVSLLFEEGSPENTVYSSFLRKHPLLALPLQSYNLNYPGLVSLAELPPRLDDFFTKLYYPSNLSHIKNPAICLHCCQIMDMQNLSLDSAKGECYQHYKQNCFNDDNGIFLLPKNTKLLLIHEDNGSFHDAPYLDPHHELDKEGTHGRVMYLSREKYSSFVRTVWLGHDITNYITRQLENNVDVGGWETL